MRDNETRSSLTVADLEKYNILSSSFAIRLQVSPNICAHVAVLVERVVLITPPRPGDDVHSAKFSTDNEGRKRYIHYS